MIKKEKKSITKRYVKTLGDVYKNEGLLSAINYDVKSTIYSLGKRLGNLYEMVFFPKQVSYNEYVSREKQRSNAWERTIAQSEANQRIAKRRKQREDYLLRGEKNLESRFMPIIAIAGLGAGIFFLSPVFTGNAVGNLNQTSSNWVGGILFVVGLVGSFIWFRKNN